MTKIELFSQIELGNFWYLFQQILKRIHNNLLHDKYRTYGSICARMMLLQWQDLLHHPDGFQTKSPTPIPHSRGIPRGPHFPQPRVANNN